MSINVGKALRRNRFKVSAVITSALMAGGGLFLGAPAAGAATPLAASCVFTGSDQITVGVDGPTGVAGLPVGTLAQVQFKDSAGTLLGTSASVSLLNGMISLPPIALTVPAGSPVATDGVNFSIVPVVAGAFNPIAGNTPCDALPTQPVTGAFESVPTQRVLDTRIGFGLPTAIAPGTSATMHILGTGGVPSSGVSAVDLVLTATGATAPGYVTVYSSGSPRPATSNLNYVAGQDVANTVLAVPGPDGNVVLYNNSTKPVNLISDVSGYYVASTLPLLPGAFQPVTPTRIFDSRTSGGKLAGQKSTTVPVAGLGGLPAAGDIGSVVLNVTATNSTLKGHLRVYPSGSALPFASNLNFDANRTVANLVTVGLGSDGAVSLFNGASFGTVDYIVDVVGYVKSGVVPAQLPGLENVVTPFRLLDTRSAIGTATRTKVPAGGTVAVQVGGVDGVPAKNVRAAVLTVTATEETSLGYATLYASGSGRPNSSVLNFLPGSDIADLVIVPVGADGKVMLYNGSTGATHLVVDVSAYITGDTVSVP